MFFHLETGCLIAVHRWGVPGVNLLLCFFQSPLKTFYTFQHPQWSSSLLKRQWFTECFLLWDFFSSTVPWTSAEQASCALGELPVLPWSKFSRDSSSSFSIDSCGIWILSSRPGCRYISPRGSIDIVHTVSLYRYAQESQDISSYK